jgi:hypothetical protein
MPAAQHPYPRVGGTCETPLNRGVRVVIVRVILMAKVLHALVRFIDVVMVARLEQNPRGPLKEEP